MAAAQANLKRNAPNTPHQTIAEDAFAALARLAKQKERYDLVIVDPPSFAKSQKEVGQALYSYARLTELALALVKENGMLVIASCSSRVTAERFFSTVFEAAEGVGRPLWEHFRTSHAVDHPISVTFPEGAYLKCLFASPID